jgi:hypothetical protein
MERREGGEGDSKIVLRRRRRLRVTRGEGVGERREERRVKKGGWRDMQWKVRYGGSGGGRRSETKERRKVETYFGESLEEVLEN